MKHHGLILSDVFHIMCGSFTGALFPLSLGKREPSKASSIIASYEEISKNIFEGIESKYSVKKVIDNSKCLQCQKKEHIRYINTIATNITYEKVFMRYYNPNKFIFTVITTLLYTTMLGNMSHKAVILSPKEEDFSFINTLPSLDSFLGMLSTGMVGVFFIIMVPRVIALVQNYNEKKTEEKKSVASKKEKKKIKEEKRDMLEREKNRFEEEKIKRSKNLEKYAREIYIETCLSDTLTHIFIPSYSCNTQGRYVFDSEKAKENSKYDYRIKDVLMASWEDKEIFKPVEIKNMLGEPNQFFSLSNFDNCSRHSTIHPEHPAQVAYQKAIQRYPNAKKFFLLSLDTEEQDDALGGFFASQAILLKGTGKELKYCACFLSSLTGSMEPYDVDHAKFTALKHVADEYVASHNLTAMLLSSLEKEKRN